ncbi:MAG: exo-alpha-sialidase [Gammaproteobacteria bacterium]|nr:MAG: exo-alpha-sialidase [Gammaproteobacteria bacterium]
MLVKMPKIIWFVLISLMLGVSVSAAQHQHKGMAKKQENTCTSISISCAKTVTSAFAPNGDLWRLWSVQQALYFEISKDNGLNFSQPEKVSIPAEDISARNENRPKIAFDKFKGVYLSWAKPREKKYTADVRFSYSSDYGSTFSTPVTVNNDNLLAGHSFNELLVTPEGDISIVWLDGRLSYQLRKQGKESNGSALFLAEANIREGKSEFSNQQLANGTCVCCRIAMDFNQQGNLAILWRHIYGDNIREFALITVNEQQTPIQVSHDHWYINGCPHHGGGISIAEDNRYHLVWFNQGEKGKGIFYAHSDDQGLTLTAPLAVGEQTKQAMHPHLINNGHQVDIVWMQFDGKKHQLWHQRSTDNGKSFGKPTVLATAPSGADRPFLIKHNGVSYVSWQKHKIGHWIKVL